MQFAALQGTYNVPGGAYTVTSTGMLGPFYPATSSGSITTATLEPLIVTLTADTVSVLADGHLLVTTAGHVKIRIPPALFKDLVALATMGLLEKLVPESEDAR